MDIDTSRKIVDFIFNSPNENIKIEFQGGEPLLNWDVIQAVVEYANEKNIISKKNLSFVICTNLTLMATNKDWHVIFSYTRAQALADGVLIDVTGQAKTLGFRVPVAVTDHLYNGYVAAVPPGLESEGQSTAGRLHDAKIISHCLPG